MNSLPIDDIHISRSKECHNHTLQTNPREEAVIFLPAHPASFAHTFVSGMQSFYFSESQDAMVLQACYEK